MEVKFEAYQALHGKGVPSGGKQGQVLTKKSDDAYDTEWRDTGNAGVGNKLYNHYIRLLQNTESAQGSGYATKMIMFSFLSTKSNSFTFDELRIEIARRVNTSALNIPVSASNWDDESIDGLANLITVAETVVVAEGVGYNASSYEPRYLFVLIDPTKAEYTDTVTEV